MRHETIETLVTEAHAARQLRRAVGNHASCAKRCAKPSPLISRSRTGPRKKALPTRKCAAACRGGRQLYAGKREKFTPDIMQQVEKAVLLQTLDQLWRDHIVTVEHLRQVVGLRGYGQRDPLSEYKTEAFTLFSAMIAKLREQATSRVMRVEIQSAGAGRMTCCPDEDDLPFMQAHHIDATTGLDDVGEGMLAVRQ